MDFSKEIAAMRKRAIKVSRITAPPTLTMPVYLQGEESPEPSGKKDLYSWVKSITRSKI